MATELEPKLARVRAYLEAHAMGAMALTLQSNFAWLTGGAENRVYSATEMGAATLLVTADARYLLTNNIEAPRLEAEEMDGLGFEPVVYPWHDDGGLAQALGRLAGSKRIAADTALPGAERRDAEIARLRYALLPEEVDRYRALAHQTAEAVQNTCRAIAPGMTEHRIAAETGVRLLAAGIQPGLILVATDARIARFRHPLPTRKALERVAMVVACGRRGGLIASVTRLVHFGPLPDDLRQRHAAVCRVDGAIMVATYPGAPVRDIFGAAVAAYADAGYPDEWRHHHQGGATGYSSRDYKATPASEEIVQPAQAFAWNPSIAGTKSEDTMLATGNGPEILSAAGNWPTVRISLPAGDLDRPGILVR